MPVKSDKVNSRLFCCIITDELELKKIFQLRDKYLSDDLKDSKTRLIDQHLDSSSIHVGFYNECTLIGAIRLTSSSDNLTYLNRLNFYDKRKDIPNNTLEISRFFLTPCSRRHCIVLLKSMCKLIRVETKYRHYLALAEEYYTKIYKRLGTVELYKGLKLRNKNSLYCISLGTF